MRILTLMLLVNLGVLTPVSPVMAEEKEEAFVLAYRLASTQTKEFDDPNKADAFAKALTKRVLRHRDIEQGMPSVAEWAALAGDLNFSPSEHSG